METKFLTATEFSGLGGGYSENGLLESHNDVSIIICVQLCLNNLACLGFFYNAMQRKCITNKVVFFKTDTYVKEDDWRYYRTSGETKCMVTENFIHNRQLKMCYLPQEDSKDWSEAKSMCNSKKANLVKIDSAAKQEHLKNTVKAMANNITNEVESGGNYKYHGCWLSIGFTATYQSTNPSMTVEICRDACKGKTYIALKSGMVCYCVSSIDDVSKKLNDTNCTRYCYGNPSQICGGHGRVEVGEETAYLGSIYDLRGLQKVSSMDLYIGLTKDASDWKWSDNQVAVYKSFNDSTSGACAVMSSLYDFRWKSVQCNSKSGFICEI